MVESRFKQGDVADLGYQSMALPTLNLRQVRVGTAVHNHFIQHLINISSTGVLISRSNDLAMEPHSERNMDSLHGRRLNSSYSILSKTAVRAQRQKSGAMHILPAQHLSTGIKATTVK